MKSSVVILLVVGIVLLLVGAWYLSNSAAGVQTQSVTTPVTEGETDDFSTGTDTSFGEIVDEATDDGSLAAGVKEFLVENNGLAFTVKQMRVNQGDTVRVTFKVNGGRHDWVIDEFNARTKLIGTGEEDTIEFVADKVGEFEYYCSVSGHRAAGMVGTLIVE